MVLSVKVSIDENTRPAHTLDITDTGARLGGLGMQLQPGMIVALQRGSQKATFRVAWIRQLAHKELQVGFESIEQLNNLWGVDLSDGGKVIQDMKVLMTLLSDRSKADS
jgi:hypothetical protein